MADEASVTRTATVTMKASDPLDGPVFYLKCEDTVFRVVVPLKTWYAAELHVPFEVPDGNLEHPTVSVKIVWPW